jgi:hypothetical protein
MGRPDVIIVSQIGQETTPGTPVAANRFLPTVHFFPKLKRDTKQFRAGGDKYDTSSVRSKQYAEGTFDGFLDYNSFIYILNGLTVPVTSPTTPAGSTTARKWSYLPLSRQLDSPKTYTIEVGDASAVDQYAYGQLTSLTVQLGQDELKYNGNLIAQTMNPNQTQTASPTQIAERPCERGQVAVYLDTNYSTFNGATPTKLLNCFEEEIQLGVKFKPKFVHDPLIKSFQEAIEVAPSLVFSFTHEHNSAGRAILADAIANDVIHYLSIRVAGNDLSTAVDGSVTELIQFDLAGKFGEPEEIKDILTMGVYGYKYHFFALDDPTMGRPWRATVVNQLTAL